MSRETMKLAAVAIMVNNVVEFVSEVLDLEVFQNELAVRAFKARFCDGLDSIDTKTRIDTARNLLIPFRSKIKELDTTIETTDPVLGDHKAVQDRKLDVLAMIHFINEYYNDSSTRIEGDEMVTGSYTLAEFVRFYEEGRFGSGTVDEMIQAGWYDWFCKDQSLPRRMKTMFGMVKAASECVLIDPHETYVFFKNNCPMQGDLYDSFSICTLDKGDVLWWVTAKEGRDGRPRIIHVPTGCSDEDNLLKNDLQGNATLVKRYFQHTELIEEAMELLVKEKKAKLAELKAKEEAAADPLQVAIDLFNRHSDEKIHLKELSEEYYIAYLGDYELTRDDYNNVYERVIGLNRERGYTHLEN